MDTQIENLMRLLGSQQDDSISVAMTLLEFDNELQSAFEQYLAQYDWIKPFIRQSEKLPYSWLFSDTAYIVNAKSTGRIPEWICWITVECCEINELVLPKSTKKLHLSKSNVGSIRLNDGLETLLINSSQVRSMNDLPKTLGYFGVCRSKLPAISKLPELLDSFAVYCCSHTMLPSSLPDKLRYLVYEEIDQFKLPTLPNSLQYLRVSDCGLDAFPKILPNKLQNLICSNNSIKELPTLPEGLVCLDASNNHIHLLPKLPSGLTNLIISGNNLSEIPKLPKGLELLKLHGNPLRLPMFDIDLVAEIKLKNGLVITF